MRVEASDAARRLDLAPDVQAQVFHIVQEALTNARKHSGAARVEIDFSIRDGGLDVVVADDGHGMGLDPGAEDRPHYGIRTMRERAESVGATVEWVDPPAGGCRVHLTVPTAVTTPLAHGIA